MRNAWWPSLETKSGAKEAAHQGAGAAVFVAAVTGLFSILAMFGVQILAGFSPTALFDAAVFGVVAWRIYKMSRAWAVVGLLGFVAERGYALYAHGFNVGAGIIVGVAILFAFINGVRGTFAFHKLSKTPIVDSPIAI
jgi:hypothetical protein